MSFSSSSFSIDLQTAIEKEKKHKTHKKTSLSREVFSASTEDSALWKSDDVLEFRLLLEVLHKTAGSCLVDI